jgi:hypothetical protein
MTQSSGAISFSQIGNAIGQGWPPISLLSAYNMSAYYNPETSVKPENGPIKFSNFYNSRGNKWWINGSLVKDLGNSAIGPWGPSYPGGDTTARWIWAWNDAGTDASTSAGPWIHFVNFFYVSTSFTADLYVIVDNYAVIFVNGNPLNLNTLFGGGWGGGTGTKRTFKLNAGYNLIDIFSYNAGSSDNPAGLIASLYNGSSLVFNTNRDWRYYKTSLYYNCFNVLFSCRQVNPFYLGAIFDIRRSSDNARSDFYCDFNQSYITTGAGGSGTTLKNWLNGSTAYVVKWYDQSDNGNHATNTTNNTTQPTLSLQNGKYVVKFVNANSTVLNITGINPKTIFSNFYNTNSELAALLNTEYDYGLRFYNRSVFGGFNNGDWYYSGNGEKLSYVNGTFMTTIVELNKWNYMCLSVASPVSSYDTSTTRNQNTYAYETYSYNYGWAYGFRTRRVFTGTITVTDTTTTQQPFTRIGGSFHAGRYLDGYMSEMICHNTTMNQEDMHNYYDSRLF